MRVAILGCGYVGRELGRQLLDAGHDAVGVVRSAESAAQVADAGIEAVRADVTDAESLSAVPDVDALVFAASTGGRDADAARETYLRGVETVLSHFGERANPPERLVFTSSTGVYGDHDGAWVDESTPLSPVTEKTEVVAEAERLVTGADAIDGTVARFAGLYGPDRYRLSYYLDRPVTEGWLNSVHRDDAAGAILHLLTADVARGEVVNVTDGAPVEKWTFADWLADEVGVERPEKRTVEERLATDDLSEAVARRVETSKRVRGDRLRELGYDCQYASVREGFRPAIEAARAAGPPS